MMEPEGNFLQGLALIRAQPSPGFSRIQGSALFRVQPYLGFSPIRGSAVVRVQPYLGFSLYSRFSLDEGSAFFEVGLSARVSDKFIGCF